MQIYLHLAKLLFYICGINNKKMELTKAALSRIEGSGRIMNLIAAEMDCTESTVRRWIAKNDTMLTTASVMKIIRQETGLKINEILKEENIQKS